MATVNSDGTPHNTPYFFMRSDDLTRLYWSSSPRSQHSKNVERTGEIFVVLYEANAGGGLYIQCHNARIATGTDLNEAIVTHNQVRKKHGLEPLSNDFYTDESVQKMYVADTEKFWINQSIRDERGNIVEDSRIEVSKDELLEISV